MQAWKLGTVRLRRFSLATGLTLQLEAGVVGGGLLILLLSDWAVPFTFPEQPESDPAARSSDHVRELLRLSCAETR